MTEKPEIRTLVAYVPICKNCLSRLADVRRMPRAPTRSRCDPRDDAAMKSLADSLSRKGKPNE